MSEAPIVRLETDFGEFDVRQHDRGLSVSKGDLSTGAPLVRIQSSCIFSESFRSISCDCALQLHASMALIAREGCGVVVYLFEEGRGAGLTAKMRAMALEKQERIDTVEAFRRLGLRADLRSYDGAIAILRELNASTHVRLITNNPSKKERLETAGYEINSVISLNLDLNDQTKAYLQMKKERLGHSYVRLD